MVIDNWREKKPFHLNRSYYLEYPAFLQTLKEDGRVNVPFLDLAGAYKELKLQLDEAHSDVMNSAWCIQANEVDSFEKEYAGHYGTNTPKNNGLTLLLFYRVIRKHPIP